MSAEQLPGLLLIVAVVGLAWAGMRRGWQSRSRRQADLPAPTSPPEDPGRPVAAAEGVYVGTVLAEHWLERVVPHGLGARAGATLTVHPSGLLLDRDGGPPLWVSAASLRTVRRDTGLAGRVTETGGLVVWTWTLGDTVLDSGFRPRYAADADTLVRAVDSLCRKVT